jgi:AcrR family transcriptional regulator
VERAAVAEEKRRLILVAAVRTFARKGYHAARVGDVAEEAGVAYGLVYHYFRSKEELLDTIFRETWNQMLATVRSIEESGVSAREQLRKVVEVVLRTWRHDPDLVRVLVREVTRTAQLEREADEIAPAFAALQRIIAHGQELSEFRRDLDPRLASWILYGALEEILTGWVLGRLPDDDEGIASAEQAVLQMLDGGVVPPAHRVPAGIR